MTLYNRIISPKKADIEFVDVIGTYAAFPQTSIKLAKDVEPFFKEHQKNKFNEFKFAKCPGMLDYARLGYIIPAWDVIKIKANNAGTACLSKKNFYSKDLEETGKFSNDIIDGLSEVDNINEFAAYNVSCPWKIRTKSNVSLLILPPTYHSKRLNDLYFLSGVIDYDMGFATINCIIAPKRKCEVIIEPGEPLIHVIPFYRKTFTADYGAFKHFDGPPMVANPFTATKNFYRKLFMSKKTFKLNFLSKK